MYICQWQIYDAQNYGGAQENDKFLCYCILRVLVSKLYHYEKVLLIFCYVRHNIFLHC